MALSRVAYYFGVMVLALLTAMMPISTRAADPFEKVKLTPSIKVYLVLTDVNIRQQPKTKSKRVGRFRKNDQVKAVGKAKGTEWVAVQKDGKNLGFVYGTALAPMIDGKLSSSLNGNLSGKDVGGFKLPPCHYKIHFDGKVKVEGDTQVTSDYLLPMQCDYDKKTIKINATMFITELPYLGNRKPVYQINVDLLNLRFEDEDIFSTTVLYDFRKSEIEFDGVNKEALQNKSKIAKKKVKNLREALKGAVEMAHESWGPKIWAELAKVVDP